MLRGDNNEGEVVGRDCKRAAGDGTRVPVHLNARFVEEDLLLGQREALGGILTRRCEMEPIVPSAKEYRVKEMDGEEIQVAKVRGDLLRGVREHVMAEGEPALVKDHRPAVGSALGVVCEMETH